MDGRAGDLGEDGLERANVGELDVGRRAAVGEVRQPCLQEGYELRTRGFCMSCDCILRSLEGVSFMEGVIYVSNNG